MMHAGGHRWPFQLQPNGGAYDDGDDEAAVDNDFGDNATSTAGRRYFSQTVRPKQWSTSYAGDGDRQHYIHSTNESAAHYNGGGIGGGLENDIYGGIGGRKTTDFFRSKTMPRRMTGAAGSRPDGRDDDDDDDDGDDENGDRRRRRGRWPPVSSSADIVAYDSSADAADAPSGQFLLPRPQQQQQQQQQQQRPADGFAQQRPPAVAARSSSKAASSKSASSKWKTRALYAFLACLLAVVVVNLALTLWFIRVTRFTTEGLGSMKIVQGGLKLSGRTLVTDRLVASAIRSRAGRPILIESAVNITLNARNSQGRLVNSLKLTKDGLECAQANVFRVTDTRGETLFSADRSKVIVGAQELRVTGSGGAVFQGSVQTPMVRADPRHDLRLESASRRLELSGPQGITIESRAGDISVSCLMDVKLQSIAGAIQIDAAKVFFRGLKTAKTSAEQPPPNSGPGGPAAKKRGIEDNKLPSVYQLCVCGNGKVFMSPPEGHCAADNESPICR